MEKVLKTACVLLILVMIFYNVPHLPVAAEDADSATPALLYDKAFMGVGERCNFDWLINIDSYYFTVADTSIAEYDETNRSYIIGKAPGTTSVSLTYIEGGTIKYASFQLEVMEQANLLGGTYSICSGYHAPLYAISATNIDGKLRLCEREANTYQTVQFNITPYSDGTYSIFSPTYNAYIGIQDNQIVDNSVASFFSSISSTIPLWKILVNSDGNYLLIPHGSQDTNLVLAVPCEPVLLDSPLILANYYEYNPYGNQSQRHLLYKSWYLYNDLLTINNHYDHSFTDTLGLLDLIPVATNFTINAYDDALSIPIGASENIVYFTSSADECTTGTNNPCSLEICGTACSDHHKNKQHLTTQVADIPHLNNHISVLWMDRPNTAYCYQNHLLGGEAVSLVMEGIPMFYVTSATTSTTSKAYEVLMGILLSHEIAHVYGLEDQYSADPLAYDPHCRNEDGEKVYNCCMERLYYSNDRDAFYDNVRDGIEDIFCPSCMELISEHRHIYFKHNYS